MEKSIIVFISCDTIFFKSDESGTYVVLHVVVFIACFSFFYSIDGLHKYYKNNQ